MDLNAAGRLLVALGLALAVLGALLILFSRVPVLKNFGHLPGDIHIKGRGYSCFFPLVSMILLSLLLTLALNLIIRLLNR